jgi:polyvinyl alcohol dehydrogenase (cytochrome)
MQFTFKLILLTLLATVQCAFAQDAFAQDGAALFTARCASCHENPDPLVNVHVPSRADMALFAPNSVYAAVTDGEMRLQVTGLSDLDLRALAKFITNRDVIDLPLRISANICANNPPMTDPALSPSWNGWGSDTSNSRYAAAGGVSANDLPKLKLKWAYGLPGESQPRGQPAVVAGRLFVGNRAGALYALDASSGCTYWSFLPRAGIRSALTVGAVTLADGSAGYAVYFIDIMANAYAVNAQTGEQLWVQRVDSHPAVRGTGSVTLHEGRLYVPITGVSEENTASNPDYSCCTFRGSITALDAQTGTVIWKSYTVDEPRPRGTSANGAALFGPAGVGIWSAPTIDAKRGLIYAATGNAYADPTPPTADSVIALAMDTGALVWSKQLTPDDAWIGGCNPATPNSNCPDAIGPDFDFSASPILTTGASGKQVLVIPQKSGMAYALDPANNGEVVWQYKAGDGSPVGGVWGAAVADGVAFVAVGGYRLAQSGGVHGINVDTGAQLWFTPPSALLCTEGPGCGSTQSAAVTAIPGAVFSGSQDGGMRAYAAQTGEILWTFDANQTFDTINGVVANGASFDGAGPVVAGRMVYMLSGNSGFVGRPGNVLLAFEITE